MAKRKQSVPNRLKADRRGGDVEDNHPPKKRHRKSPPVEDATWKSLLLPDIGAHEGKQVAEITLLVANSATGSSECLQDDQVEGFKHSDLRIKVQMPKKSKMTIQIPKLSQKDLRVQVVICPKASTSDANEGKTSEIRADLEDLPVLISRHIDGPDDVISSLAYLFSKEYASLMPAPLLGSSQNGVHELPARLRVVICAKAFTCLDGSSGKYICKKAMKAVISWLRPELVSDMRDYDLRFTSHCHEETTSNTKQFADENGSSKRQMFDPSTLYEALARSCTQPALDMSSPELLSELRRYQHHAVSWMVQRERGLSTGPCSLLPTPTTHEEDHENSTARKLYLDEHPLWVSVLPVDDSSPFFYNPFTGAVSLEPKDPISYVNGGILADEMGLGKTVELLACILANPCKGVSDIVLPNNLGLSKKLGNLDHIDCPCGAQDVDEKKMESWVLCDACEAWQHADCAGYTPPRKDTTNLGEMISLNGNKSYTPKRKRSKKSGQQTIQGDDDNFVCRACAKLIGSVQVEGICKSTLVVCPTPILQQWQDEILRHTRSGALRVIVYNGVSKGAYTLMEGKDTPAKHSNRLKVVSAHDLAAADIVLTTYDTLRTDLCHSADESKIRYPTMRYLKRFPVLPTPLTRLRWWRVCLDEAQMVESSSARAAEMCLLLKGRYRWCSTGTPIRRGLSDVYGLLKFLQAEPFDDFQNWNRALQQPYEAGNAEVRKFMHKYLRTIMWRSSKVQVKDELNLPPQEETVSWLRFSPVESHFYSQLHEKCAVKAKDMIAQCRQHNSDSDKPLSTSEISLLSKRLIKLRQACCHPQVGRAGVRSLHQQSPMTMDEILQVLVDRAKLDAEEAQRALISALNGLAALAAIDGDLKLAVELYRDALTSTEQHAADVDVDPLQRLHTLHNLADVMGMCAVVVPGERSTSTQDAVLNEALAASTMETSTNGGMPDRRVIPGEVAAGLLVIGRHNNPKTVRDDKMLQECQEIRSKYMAAFDAKVSSSRADFWNAHLQVSEAKRDCEEHGGTSWWMEVMTSGTDLQANQIARKIRNNLMDDDFGQRGKNHNASNFALRFRDATGLKVVLEIELRELDNARDLVLERFKRLTEAMKNPTAEDSVRIVNCSRDNLTKNGPLCPHCEMDDVFMMYENRLLLLRTAATSGVVSAEDAGIARQRIDDNRRRTKGTEDVPLPSKRGTAKTGPSEAQVLRLPSQLEEILSQLKAFSEHARGQRGAARKHLKTFEFMKKEYSQMRALATVQRQKLLALDELNMATIRLSLRLPGEIIDNDIEEQVKMSAEEVPVRNVQLTTDRVAATEALASAKGQLRYLKGLSKSRIQKQKQHQTRVVSDNAVSLAGCVDKNYTTTEGGASAEEDHCPVCQDPLGTEMMVMPCGHFLCCKCCMRIIDRQPGPSDREKKISCPTCRSRHLQMNIAYVDNRTDSNVLDTIMTRSPNGKDKETIIHVEGSYGTKIEAVVRRLLRIKASEPKAKVLVFSTWHEVLDVLEHALSANSVTFARVKGPKLYEPIRKFQGLTTKEHIQVLLLPTEKGANGLNLVEAQHVILVEPLPNPAMEAQAINRVHRIGQTQPTFVHRIIVKDTVEEKIYLLGRKKADLVKGFPSGGTGFRKDQYSLTLNDVNDLFPQSPSNEGTPPAVPDESQVWKSLPRRDLLAAAAEGRIAR